MFSNAKKSLRGKPDSEMTYEEMAQVDAEVEATLSADLKTANDAAYAAHQAAERVAQEAMDAEAMALHRRAGKRELAQLAAASEAAQAAADKAEQAFFNARAAWANAKESA